MKTNILIIYKHPHQTPSPFSSSFFYYGQSFFSSLCSLSSWEHVVLHFHKTLVKKSPFFCHSVFFCSDCQNQLWCQVSVHIIHKQNTTGESQGLVHIVGNINGSYFAQFNLKPCNDFQVPLSSGPHSWSPLFP